MSGLLGFPRRPFGSTQKPLVYVCARYSASTPEGIKANVDRAIAIGAIINRSGLAWAVVPHQLGREMESSLSPRGWYEFTLSVMLRCDAVWFTGDDTIGCNLEILNARVLGIPVGECPEQQEQFAPDAAEFALLSFLSSLTSREGT